MSTPKITKAMELTSDVRQWLEIQFKKPISTLTILKKMKEAFKWTIGFPIEELEAYRLSVVPTYKQTIEKSTNETSLVDTPEEELFHTNDNTKEIDQMSKNELKKFNMLKSHRKILNELSTNYSMIKDYDDDAIKVKYLEAMAKELQVIAQLEASERDFISAMVEVRKIEEKLTLNQHLDSIMGYWIPRMAEKGKDKNEILEALFQIQLMINQYSKLILTEPDTEQANRELLELMYGNKELRKIV